MSTFDKDRWQRLQPFLDEALELSNEARASWIVALRMSAPDVADELVSLFSSEAEADGSGFLADSYATHRWTLRALRQLDSIGQDPRPRERDPH